MIQEIISFLPTYPRTRLIEVSMTLVACLLSFLDLLLLLWRCLCTRSGPLDLVRIPSRRSLTSSLTRPCLLTLASSAAVLISLVLIGGTSTFGGGGAFKSPCSEKFQMFTQFFKHVFSIHIFLRRLMLNTKTYHITTIQRL